MKTLKFLLIQMNLMKNKLLKMFHKHENFVFCKLLPSLDYTLNYTVSSLNYSYIFRAYSRK